MTREGLPQWTGALPIRSTSTVYLSLDFSESSEFLESQDQEDSRSWISLESASRKALSLYSIKTLAPQRTERTFTKGSRPKSRSLKCFRVSTL